MNWYLSSSDVSLTLPAGPLTTWTELYNNGDGSSKSLEFNEMSGELDLVVHEAKVNLSDLQTQDPRRVFSTLDVPQSTIVVYPLIQYDDVLSKEAYRGRSKSIANDSAVRLAQHSKVTSIVVTIGNDYLAVDYVRHTQVEAPSGSTIATVFNNAHESDEAVVGP